MPAHAYTKAQLVEQPATRGKAEGEMLKAEMPPKSITAAVDKLSRRLSALPPLWGAVNLKPN
jgi:hypothetical protein